MQFQNGSSISGPYEFGYEEGWHWSKNGGNYNSGRDFFSVHWEISDHKPGDVKLHIESPKSNVEPKLNEIKKEMVEQFLSVRFKNLVEEKGFVYVVGRNIGSSSIEKNKSTQAFRVAVSNEQRLGSHQANIEMMNSIAGEAVREVVGRFAKQIDAHF